MTQMYCPDETRKKIIRAEGKRNGIDYLEVLDDNAPTGSPPQRTLLVHCFQSVADLTEANVRIEGGARNSAIGIEWARPANPEKLAGLINDEENKYFFTDPENKLDNTVLVIRTDRRGDFSTYTLRLVFPQNHNNIEFEFDPLLASVNFSFKVDCSSDFDCAPAPICPDPVLPAPAIDYLAKDYASFRRLILDRLAVIMPDWRERNPADLGIALAELLAYVGDQLSYYQDAVATEAYLGTARRRVSVRRHARLVDYFLHDGANARAWVAIQVEPGGGADGATLLAHTPILTREGDATTLSPLHLDQAVSRGALIFETLHDITLDSSRNEIQFYTWRDPNCCLPKGATRVTLRGATHLKLAEGDVLIFEEVLGVESGKSQDADPAHRHAVRLNAEPIERTDPSNDAKVIEISWHADDALPFALCLHEFSDGNGKTKMASIARGNIVLADHGRTRVNEKLIPDQATEGKRYRPILPRTGITFAMEYADEIARGESAFAALKLDLRRVMPCVTLTGEFADWQPQRDLLSSDRFAPEFVVEMESDERAYIRFGDDILGRAPAPESKFTATYRVGNGVRGNVGAEALGRIATDLDGITRVYNPLPATGGTAPESLDHARLSAPEAFRTQERAVTESDYAMVAQRHSQVQRAAATRRWTGSWHTMFVTIDRTNGRAVDREFETDLRAFLERFRMAGVDLEVDAPHFISLDIALTVCVAPGYLRSHIKQSLVETFSNRDLPDGRRGFFHPDNFTFGQSVYLSQIIARVMQTPGVAWVQPTRFQRWRQSAETELQDGVMKFGRLEIAHLDNDPSQPENGRIEFEMQGGL